MSETTNLKLFKHDEPLTTNQNQFDIDKALHQNWDKIDEYVGTNTQNIQTLQQENTELQEENTLLKSQIPNGQAVGENITLTDSSNLPYEKFNICGNSVQDGTPAPEAPVEIKSVGDDGTIGIKQSAKNQLKGFEEGETSYFYSLTQSELADNFYFKATPLADNWLKVACDRTGETTTDVKYINVFIDINKLPNLKVSTDYTIIVEFRNADITQMRGNMIIGNTSSSDNTFNQIFSKSQHIYVNSIQNGETVKILNPTLDTFENQKVALRNFHSVLSGDKFSYEMRVSVVEGNYTNKDYIYDNYKANDYILQILEPLRSLPNGVRDIKEEGKIHRRVGVVVLDGSETDISLNVRTNGYQFDLKNASGSNGDSENITMLSSHFTGIKFNDRDNYSEAIYSYSGDNRIRIITNKATTIEEFKTLLSANPVTVQYKLAKEIIEPYTDNQLQKATSYKNITHIFSTDEVSPVFDITYKKDLETLFNNLNSALVQGGV